MNRSCCHHHQHHQEQPQPQPPLLPPPTKRLKRCCGCDNNTSITTTNTTTTTNTDDHWYAMMIHLNECGIVHFMNDDGQDEKALECFIDALWLLQLQEESHHHQAVTTTLDDHSNTAVSLSLQHNNHCCFHEGPLMASSVQPSAGPTTCTSSTSQTTKTSTSTTSCTGSSSSRTGPNVFSSSSFIPQHPPRYTPPSHYIHQRQAYDEGMNFYSDVLSLSGNRTVVTLTSTSTVLYNIGQVYSKRGLYDIACQWFMKAFIHLKSTIIVMGDDDDDNDNLVDNLDTTTNNTDHTNTSSSSSLSSTLMTSTSTDTSTLNDSNDNSNSSMNHENDTTSQDSNSNSNSNNTYDDNNDNDNKNRKLLLVQICCNIGLCHYRQGCNSNAMDWFTKALQTVQRHNNNNSNSNNKNSLSEVHEAAIQIAISVLLFHEDSIQYKQKCLDTFHTSLQVFIKVKGNESKEVGTIYNNIGRLYAANQDIELAKQSYEIALAIRQQRRNNKQKTKKIITTTTTRNNTNTTKNGTTTTTTTSCCNVHSIDVAATICNLGQLYQKSGHYDIAIQYYSTFLEIMQEGQQQQQQKLHATTAAPHRDVALVLCYLGEVYHLQKKRLAARYWYEKALSSTIYSTTTTTTTDCSDSYYNPEVALILNKLGNLHYESLEFDVALGYYQQGLVIEEELFSPTHPSIITTLTNIALIYRKQGKYQMAFACYSETYRRRATNNVSSSSDHNIQLATTLSDMGLMRYLMGDYYFAFEFYQETIRLQRQHYEEKDNLEMAATLNSLGLAAFNNNSDPNSKKMALEYFQESLRMRNQLKGPDHIDLAPLWYNIGTIYLEQGIDDEALIFYNEALRLERKVPEKDHRDIVLTLQHIGLVYQNRGEWEEAIEYYSEAVGILLTSKGDTKAIATLLNLIGTISLHKGNIQDMMEYYVAATRLYRKNSNELDVVGSVIVSGYNFYSISKKFPLCAATA